MLHITNVVSIDDNGKFVTLVTASGSVIHLPMACECICTNDVMDNIGCQCNGPRGKHLIIINYDDSVDIDINQG